MGPLDSIQDEGRVERIFVIGDIHGYLNKLVQLMEKIDPVPKEDMIVFLGDYIDRGPNSKEVVEYIINIQRDFEKVVSLIGNHELMFIDYLMGGSDKWNFLLNGGLETIHSYDLTGDDPEENMPDEHMAFFNSLKPYYETEDYIFVHAGLKEGVPLWDQKLKDLVWIRREFLESDYDYGKVVVFGHSPFVEPLVTPTKIGIDTGAGYGSRLTCMELPAIRFVSVLGN